MGLKSYAKGVVKEGKRVRWPKRDVLIPSIVVVVVIADSGLFSLLWLQESST